LFYLWQDEGVILLCKHHAGPVVHAAVAEYIEKGGRDMNNPSAYLTFLVTKFAKEGIHDVEDTGKSKKKSNPSRKRQNSSSRSIEDKDGKRTKQWKRTDEFANPGVDMKAKTNLRKTFPQFSLLLNVAGAEAICAMFEDDKVVANL